jgi:predicted Zn finger-like uncharacterized protein
MLIVCPTCATSYDVDAASLRPSGRQVRCVRCRAVWRAELSQAEKLIAAAEALAPVRRAVEAMAEATAEESVAALPEEEFAATAFPGADDAAEAFPSGTSAGGPQAAASDSPGLESSSSDTVEVESPPIAPADPDTTQPPIAAAVADAAPPVKPPEDIESFAARRQRAKAKRRKWAWPLSRLQSAILALIVANAIVVGWRADFVRVLPQTASFYAAIGMPVNLRGLTFDSLETGNEQHENVPILVVQGNIVNDARKIVDVPRLRFAVRNAAREEIYSWTAVPPRAVLSPGEAVAFRTRLASPPPDAHDILVRFLNRIDVLSGTR